jgi:actin-related protein
MSDPAEGARQRIGALGDKLNVEVGQTVDAVFAQHVHPLMREKFACQTRCCDQSKKFEEVNACSSSCEEKVANAFSVMHQHLARFQSAFQVG